MSKRKKYSRAVQRHKRVVLMSRSIVSKVMEPAFFDFYNTLCEQPLRRRWATALRILQGRKLKVK